MSLIRYRPIIKNKEADMAVDVSGAWTSLTCYYTLHDKIVTLQSDKERLQAENERLRNAGSNLYSLAKILIYCLGDKEKDNPALDEWLKAKGVQS